MAKKIITKRRLILIALVIMALLAIFLPGYTKLQDIIAENRELGKRIAELESSIDELSREKERLEDDIVYIEKIAREKMGLIKKGEKKIERQE